MVATQGLLLQPIPVRRIHSSLMVPRHMRKGHRRQEEQRAKSQWRWREAQAAAAAQRRVHKVKLTRSFLLRSDILVGEVQRGTAQQQREQQQQQEEEQQQQHAQ